MKTKKMLHIGMVAGLLFNSQLATMTAVAEEITGTEAATETPQPAEEVPEVAVPDPVVPEVVEPEVTPEPTPEPAPEVVKTPEVVETPVAPDVTSGGQQKAPVKETRPAMQMQTLGGQKASRKVSAPGLEAVSVAFTTGDEDNLKVGDEVEYTIFLYFDTSLTDYSIKEIEGLEIAGVGYSMASSGENTLTITYQGTITSRQSTTIGVNAIVWRYDGSEVTGDYNFSQTINIDKGAGIPLAEGELEVGERYFNNVQLKAPVSSTPTLNDAVEVKVVQTPPVNHWISNDGTSIDPDSQGWINVSPPNGMPLDGSFYLLARTKANEDYEMGPFKAYGPYTLNHDPILANNQAYTFEMGQSITQQLGGQNINRRSEGWSATDLPAGLALGTGGVISGTPTEAVTNQQVTVSYLGPDNVTYSKDITITVRKAAGAAVSGAPTQDLESSTYKSIVVNPVENVGGTGQDVEYAISTDANADPASLTWTVDKTHFDADVHDQKEYYVFARTQGNASYEAGASQKGGPFKVKPADFPDQNMDDAKVGTLYSTPIFATNYDAGTHFDLASGSSLPPGLFMSGSSGMITGTPTKRGSYSFTVDLLYGTRTVASATISIEVEGKTGATIATPGKLISASDTTAVFNEATLAEATGQEIEYYLCDENGEQLAGPSEAVAGKITYTSLEPNAIYKLQMRAKASDTHEAGEVVFGTPFTINGVVNLRQEVQELLAETDPTDYVAADQEDVREALADLLNLFEEGTTTHEALEEAYLATLDVLADATLKGAGAALDTADIAYDEDVRNYSTVAFQEVPNRSGNGQAVEYGFSQTLIDVADPEAVAGANITWGASRSAVDDQPYENAPIYFYARTKENDTHKAGQPIVSGPSLPDYEAEFAAQSFTGKVNEALSNVQLVAENYDHSVVTFQLADGSELPAGVEFGQGAELVGTPAKGGLQQFTVEMIATRPDDSKLTIGSAEITLDVEKLTSATASVEPKYLAATANSITLSEAALDRPTGQTIGYSLIEIGGNSTRITPTAGKLLLENLDPAKEYTLSYAAEESETHYGDALRRMPISFATYAEELENVKEEIAELLENQSPFDYIEEDRDAFQEVYDKLQEVYENQDATLEELQTALEEYQQVAGGLEYAKFAILHDGALHMKRGDKKTIQLEANRKTQEMRHDWELLNSATAPAFVTVSPTGAMAIDLTDVTAGTYTFDVQVTANEIPRLLMTSRLARQVENPWVAQRQFTLNVTENDPETVTYTVTFDSNEGTPVPKQEVEAGKPATKPANPTKAGHTFAGWFTEAGLVTAYDFATAVNEDITLYAKWTPVDGEEEEEEPKPNDQQNNGSGGGSGSGVTLSDTSAGKSSHSTIGKTGMVSGLGLSMLGLGSVVSALAVWKKRKK